MRSPNRIADAKAAAFRPDVSFHDAIGRVANLFQKCAWLPLRAWAGHGNGFDGAATQRDKPPVGPRVLSEIEFPRVRRRRRVRQLAEHARRSPGRTPSSRPSTINRQFPLAGSHVMPSRIASTETSIRLRSTDGIARKGVDSAAGNSSAALVAITSIAAGAAS